MKNTEEVRFLPRKCRKPNSIELESFQKEEMFRHLKGLDSQLRTTILLIGDLRRELEDLRRQMDTRFNNLQLQQRKVAELIATGEIDRYANKPAEDLAINKGAPSK